MQQTFDSSTNSSFRNIVARNSIILLVVIGILGYAAYDSSENFNSFLTEFIPLSVFVVVVAKVFFFKKIKRVFLTNEEGVIVDNTLYPWVGMKKFHMLGDSQDERVGLVTARIKSLDTGMDVINPYAMTNVFIIQSKGGIFGKTLNLQVSPEQTEEFKRMLLDHNIRKESKLGMLVFGMNKWFIFLFLVPFTILIAYLIMGSSQ